MRDFKFHPIKLFSLLLAVVMIISAISISAVSAASTEENSADIVENIEATEATQSTEEIEQPTEGTPDEDDTDPEPSEPLVTEITPDPVAVVKAKSVKTGSLILKWKKSKNATQYVIYRSKEKSDKTMARFTRYAETTETEFKDKRLKQAHRYKYKVYAFRTTDEYTTHSSATAVSVMTKPKPVAKVKLSDKKTSSMKLSWRKNARASRYKIYRAAENSDGTFGNFKKLKEVKAGKNSIVDKNLSAGTIYKYQVKVLRKNGDLSAVSRAKATGGMTALAAPANFANAKSTPTSISLGWSKTNTAGKFEIYRNSKLVKTTKDTTYIDSKLSGGTSYRYAVRAIRTYKKKVYKSEFVKLVASTTIYVPTVPDGLSGTWVEVSISTQTMRMYVDNKLYVSTPVVTGNDGNLSTTRGHHRVISKKSPARLRGSYNGSSWDTPVNYWLGFTSYGQGLHDSTWRSAYGGSIYKGDGSHGCVNTPLSAMSKIYSKAYIGMPVIVY